MQAQTQHQARRRRRNHSTPALQSRPAGLLVVGVVLVATVVPASWYFGWVGTFQQVTLLGVAGMSLLANWLWSRVNAEHRSSRDQDSILVSFRRGLLLGVTILSLSGILIAGAGAFPTYGRYLDRDRPQLEKQISLLASANNYRRATEIIDERLTKPMSMAWQHTLRQQQVALLTQAAATAKSTQEQRACLEAAVSLAEQFSISADEARLRLQFLLTEQRRVAEIGQLKRELQQQAAASATALDRLPASWLERLGAAQNHNAVDALLAVLLEDQPNNSPRQQLRLENLISWGDRLEETDQQADKYRQAFDLAKQHGLDSRLAASRLSSIRSKQQQRPVILPAGTRVYTTPTVIGNGTNKVQFRLEDAQLKFVAGLEKKDCQLFQGEQSIDDFEIVAFHSYSHKSTSVAMLLDESPSTQSVQKELRQALAALVTNSPPHLQFLAMAFANEIHAKSDWTRDEKKILAVLHSGTAGEGTALKSSILSAVKQLKSRPQPRILVVFTDGADTTNSLTPSEKELIDSCLAADVQVFCLGLESVDLDDRLLISLSKATKGNYLKSRNAKELSRLFGHLQRELSRQSYQLRILQADAQQKPYTLRIGRGDSSLRININQGTAKPKQPQSPTTQN